MTSSGVAIISRSGRVATTPMISKMSPPTIPSAIEVCTVSETALSSFAPWYLATSTLVPMDSPINRLTSRLISEPVEPTAARAVFPVNLPTTITSAVLNRS